MPTAQTTPIIATGDNRRSRSVTVDFHHRGDPEQTILRFPQQASPAGLREGNKPRPIVRLCRRAGLCRLLFLLTRPKRYDKMIREHFALLRGYGGIGRRVRFRILCRKARRFDPCYPHHERANFCLPRQRFAFSMISVSFGTDDIWLRRMKGRILYHACKASRSYGTPYIISRYDIKPIKEGAFISENASLDLSFEFAVAYRKSC